MSIILQVNITLNGVINTCYSCAENLKLSVKCYGLPYCQAFFKVKVTVPLGLCIFVLSPPDQYLIIMTVLTASQY
jgi:hypothetical protein